TSLFFFSSRRRHTRSKRDWSSDVCSSDLTAKDPFHRYNSVHEMEDALVQSLDPSLANVAKYTPPFEAGEETKAIPVITDDQLKDASADETLVHHAGETKKVEEKPTKVEEN